MSDNLNKLLRKSSCYKTECAGICFTKRDVQKVQRMAFFSKILIQKRRQNIRPDLKNIITERIQ